MMGPFQFCKRRIVGAAVAVGFAAAYLVAVSLFCIAYFGKYNAEMYEVWRGGLDRAVSRELVLGDDNAIYVDDAYYDAVLLFAEYPADQLIDEGEWDDANARSAKLVKANPFVFGSLKAGNHDNRAIYICSASNSEEISWHKSNGCIVEQFGTYVVAHLDRIASEEEAGVKIGL